MSWNIRRAFIEIILGFNLVAILLVITITVRIRTFSNPVRSKIQLSEHLMINDLVYHIYSCENKLISMC